MKFNRMPVVCAFTLALATTLGLSGCSLSELSTPSVKDAEAQARAELKAEVTEPVIKTPNKLIVGIRSTFAKPPLYMQDTNGRTTGLDVDMASALADTLGLDVEFVVVNQKDTPETANCDIIMDVTPADSANLTVVGNYCEAATAFFTKANAHTADISEINGKKVGLQTASASQQALKQTNLSVQEVSFENLNKAFEALSKGEVDFVMCDAYTGAYLANLYDSINMVGTLEVPQAYGVGVSSTNVALQQTIQAAMDKLANNGISDLVHSRWVGSIGVISSSSKIRGVEKKVADAESEDGTNPDSNASASPESSLQEPNGEVTNAGANAANV